MSLEQFTYTASPWGPSAPGWTVFQCSPGVGPKSASALMPYFEFKNPDLGGGDGTESIDNHRLPIRFVYCKRPGDGNRLEDGKRIVAQSLDAGLRWYDKTRGRDYFAHVFVEKGEGDVFSGIKKSFNPMALLLSETIKTEFPQEYRERALGILNGDYPDEPTPEFPVLGTISDIQTNPNFSDNQLFEKLSDGLVQKIGRIVFAMFRFASKTGGSTLAFDGTKSASFDVMAIAVRLLPLVIRRDISFSTWLPSGEARTFPGAERLSFVGTFREGESADPDTGLYGALPEGGPDFRSREDVELFKRMVDAGGTELKEEDFDNLVLCWEVAAGRKTDVESLRKAVQFAKRFPSVKDETGMEDVIVSGLKNGYPDPMITVVAWFELDIPECKEEAIEICKNCVQTGDSDSFSHYLGILGDEEARRRFLEQSAWTGVSFVEFWISHGADIRRVVPETKDRGEKSSFNSLANLVEDFARVCNCVSQGTVAPGEVDKDLETIRKMEGRFGTEVKGMKDAKRELEYLKALNDVRTHGDVPSFWASAKELGIEDDARIKSDVLSRVSPEKLGAADLWNALDTKSFSNIGLEPEDVVQRALDAAERRGKTAGDQRAEEADRKAEARAREEEEKADARIAEMKRKVEEADLVASRYRFRAKLAFPLALLAFLVGIAVGLFGPRCLPNRNEVVKETESAVEAGDVSGAESSKTNERPPSRMKRTEPSQPGVSADVPTDVIGTGSSNVSQDGSPGFQSDGMLKGGQSRGGGSVGQPLVVGKVPSQTEPNPKQFSQTRPGTADLQKNAATTTDRKAGSPQMEENELADPDIRRGELKNDSRDGVAAADESKSSSDEGKAE